MQHKVKMQKKYSFNFDKSLLGYSWLLRSYFNRLGLFSTFLIFLTLTTLWLVSIITHQYKVTYFNELRGIYPPLYTHPGALLNFAKENKLEGAIKQEHFMISLDVCIDDNKGLGYRPIRTGVRSLSHNTIAAQTSLYGAKNTHGVWLSSELYEVIFGEPASNIIENKSIKLVASDGDYLNPLTCQTNSSSIELPILKVIPLKSTDKWLIVKTETVESMYLDVRLNQIDVLYPTVSGNDEQQLYAKLRRHLDVKYWVEQLPYTLQVNLKKLQMGVLLFLAMTCLMAISFVANLYLMTQKTLQENFYILRFYGVKRRRFFKSAFIALSVFWLMQFGLSLTVAYGILAFSDAELFQGFDLVSYLLNIPINIYIGLFFSSVFLPLLYILTHFVGNKYNHKWKDTQH